MRKMYRPTCVAPAPVVLLMPAYGGESSFSCNSNAANTRGNDVCGRLSSVHST